jgi:hypothetical protein
LNSKGRVTIDHHQKCLELSTRLEGDPEMIREIHDAILRCSSRRSKSQRYLVHHQKKKHVSQFTKKYPYELDHGCPNLMTS